MNTTKKSILYAILLLVCLNLVSVSLNAQAKESGTTKYHTESNGFKWIETIEDGKSMAIDVEGNIIIPPTRGYNKIIFQEHGKAGWFLVEEDGKLGACDIAGIVVFSPMRTWKIFVDNNDHQFKYCKYDKGNKKDNYEWTSSCYLNFQGHACSEDRVSEDYLCAFDGSRKELVYNGYGDGEPEYIFRKDGVAWSTGKYLSKDNGYNNLIRDKESGKWYLFKNDKVGIYGYIPSKDKWGIVIPLSRDYDRVLIQPVSINRYYYLFWKNGLMGVCDSSGHEVVKPKYSTLIYDELIGFASQENDQWTSLGVYFDINGKGYKSSENLFYKYAVEGDKQLEKKQYSAAISSYKKAQKYWLDTTAFDNVRNNEGLAYYNLGVIYFNKGKYKKSSRQFREASWRSKDKELKIAAESMESKSRQMAEQKSAERTEAFFGALAMVSSTMIKVGYNMMVNSGMYSPNGYIPSNTGGTNYNYLLDPNYAIWQAQQQQAEFDAINQQLINLSIQQTEQQEYETYLLMTSGGTSMSFEEWKSLAAQAAWNEANGMDFNGVDFNFNDNDGNEYKGKLRPDQYEEAYRRYESSAQDYYRYLTMDGVREQDKNGNIQGKTVGQISGGGYVAWKQGLRKAQAEMRRIRQEAAQYGVTIQQSQWETATASY